MVKYWIRYVVVIFIAGCGALPPIDFSDPQNIADNIRIEKDEYQKTTSVLAPNLMRSLYDKGFGNKLLIAAIKNDGESYFYFIYLTHYYEDPWRFYDKAFDINGRKLPTTVIDREAVGCASSGCGHREHIGLTVDKAYLEQNTVDGLQIKVIGKAGEHEFRIPGPYIQPFLDAVESS